MYRNKFNSGLAVLVTVTMLSTASQAVADSCSAGKKDIVDTAAAAGSFNTLATALTEAGLVDVLKGSGPFTVFAPTDDAFAALPGSTLKDLLKSKNKDRLADILTYHVITGRVPAEQAVKLTNAQTLNGQQINLVFTAGGLTVDGAKVVTTDIECSNGVIHVIDRVMIPSDKDIFATAHDAGNFKTLIAAVKAANLKGALQGDGPFTVFAPTDEAFAKLPKGTIETLLQAENREKLASILKLHVAPGRAFATDALVAGEARTLQGETVQFRITDGRMRVNDAAIVKTNIDASNGVIHVIDTVLLPEDHGGGDAVSALDVIELAIERGVPMFNNGNPAACTAIYEVTVQSLLSMDIEKDVQTQLKRAMDKARSTLDVTDQAWILRRALDAAYARL